MHSPVLCPHVKPGGKKLRFLVGQIWPNLWQLQREEESAQGISVGPPASQIFSSQGTKASVLPSGGGFLEGKVRSEFGSFPERSDSNS